jgi:hypothetical protein
MIGVRAVRPNFSNLARLDQTLAIPRIATGTAALRTRSAIPSPTLQLRRNISQLLAQRASSSSLPIITSSRFSIHFASRRYASTSTEEATASSSDAKRTNVAEEDANNTTTQTRATAGEMELIYDAPKKGILRGLKLFSLTTCLASLAGTPILVMFGNPDVPLLGRSALGITALFFGVSTTALLNHLTKGYVTKAYLTTPTVLADGHAPEEQPKQKLVLHTYNLLTRTRTEEVDVDDIQAPQTIMPYVTFYSERNRKNYCLEYTAFEDKDLWHDLFPFADRE